MSRKVIDSEVLKCYDLLPDALMKPELQNLKVVSKFQWDDDAEIRTEEDLVKSQILTFMNILPSNENTFLRFSNSEKKRLSINQNSFIRSICLYLQNTELFVIHYLISLYLLYQIYAISGTHNLRVVKFENLLSGEYSIIKKSDTKFFMIEAHRKLFVKLCSELNSIVESIL